jgi:hypothetical protein
MSCHRQQRVPIATRPCPAMMTNLMTNTAVTGATLDIDGGQQLVEGSSEAS